MEAEPDAYGLVGDEGRHDLRHPTKPSKARVAVGLASSVLMDIDLPDDYKESAAFAWDNDTPADTKPGLYDVEVLWLWDSEWNEMSGETYHSFYIKAVKWPNGTVVGDTEAFDPQPIKAVQCEQACSHGQPCSCDLLGDKGGEP